MSDAIIEEKIDKLLYKIIDFIDQNTFNKILNKITDYAEPLSEGKLSGLVNFNYRLNSEQTGRIIDLLVQINAVSIINNVALKGSKNLEIEYISNIFSDTIMPENISSYVSIRNFLENRLAHQVQQYNMNMSKSNTTQSMPLNELRGHVKTFNDLINSNLPISTKVQHGMIAASLHDAYIIFINKTDWWNDKTYMKFFFNDDDQKHRDKFLLSHIKRLTPVDIKHQIDECIEKMVSIKTSRQNQLSEQQASENNEKSSHQQHLSSQTKQFNDKMLLTPFGRQYGNKIDQILESIFSSDKYELYKDYTDDTIREKIAPLINNYLATGSEETLSGHNDLITEIVEYLLLQDYTIKEYTERILHINKKETFGYFYEKNKIIIDNFTYHLFAAYFEDRFSSLFKIVRTQDLKRFACAYIIKRIYLLYGETITRLGYLLINTIAKLGGIKNQQ